MSAIWAHFKINDDDRSKAQCKICTATVSRGGKESTSFNTSNLIIHLKTHHSAEYTTFTDANGTRQKQPILTDVLQKKKTRTHTQRERGREKDLCPNYRSASVSVQTHSHALATPFPVVERPSEPFGELDGHPRAPLDSCNVFGYERIATDTPLAVIGPLTKSFPNDIISGISHFLFHSLSCSYSVIECGSAKYSCPSPACVRQSSARARQPFKYIVGIQPDIVNVSTVHTNDTFTYVFYE